MKRLLLATLAALLAGCSVQGRPFERAYSPPGHAVINVYRPYHYGGSLLRPAVTCGDETARVGPGGYHPFIAPAGKVLCRVHQETLDEVELLVEPRVYYIREEMTWGLLSGHPHLTPVDSDKAQTEIQSCCVLER